MQVIYVLYYMNCKIMQLPYEYQLEVTVLNIYIHAQMSGKCG